MSPSIRAVVPIALAGVGWACAQPAPEEGGPESLTGCYRFERGEGADALGLPWGVALEEDELEEGWPILDDFERVHTARTLPRPGERTDHPFAYWRITEADSVEIGHPGGGGVVLVLAADEEALVGRGRSAGDALAPGDAGEARRTYPVRAPRVECGDEDAPTRALHPPDAVRLASLFLSTGSPRPLRGWPPRPGLRRSGSRS